MFSSFWNHGNIRQSAEQGKSKPRCTTNAAMENVTSSKCLRVESRTNTRKFCANTEKVLWKMKCFKQLLNYFHVVDQIPVLIFSLLIILFQRDKWNGTGYRMLHKGLSVSRSTRYLPSDKVWSSLGVSFVLILYIISARGCLGIYFIRKLA